MVFLTMSDAFLMCAIACILQIPLALPVFKREQGSRMYTPAAYYIAGLLANICSFIFYPVMVSLITF